MPTRNRALKRWPVQYGQERVHIYKVIIHQFRKQVFWRISETDDVLLSQILPLSEKESDVIRSAFPLQENKSQKESQEKDRRIYAVTEVTLQQIEAV